jgi:transcriptional regulator with XRE-family HTH domain
MLPMDLGERVRHVRGIRGYASTELDRLAGVSQGTTSRLESKQRGKFGGTGSTIGRIAKALGVSLEWLMTGQGPMEEAQEDPLPNRALAVSIARDGGVAEEAILAVLALPVRDAEKRTALWWIDAFRVREALLKQEQELDATGAVPPRGVPSHAPAVGDRRRKARPRVEQASED